MSKSDKNKKGTIFLLEDPEVAYKKILKAVTDSEGKVYISEDKPGILNLLTIYASIKNISLEEAESIFKDSNYKEFKEAVALVVKDLLISIQSKYQDALTQVEQVIEQGKIKAQLIARNTLNKMQINIGLYGEKHESK